MYAEMANRKLEAAIHKIWKNADTARLSGEKFSAHKICKLCY